ncbi:MAG: hypothetical protein KDB18_13990, partial [Salinibacterium sp.]|nr:hypothetical protein [Salinibacterium sp.]
RWGSSAVATSFAVLFLTRGLRARGGETLDPVGFLLGKLDPQSREFEIEAAVDTVCKMGRAALPALLPLLESEERVVRKAAVSILRRLVKERGGYDPEESPRSLENQRAIARWKEIIDHLPS